MGHSKESFARCNIAFTRALSVIFSLTFELCLLPGRGSADLQLFVLVVDDEVKGHGTVHFRAGGIERQLSHGLLLVLHTAVGRTK